MKYEPPADAQQRQLQNYRQRLRKQLLLDIHNDNPLHGETMDILGDYYGYHFDARRLNFLLLNLVPKSGETDVSRDGAFMAAEQILAEHLLPLCGEGETCITHNFLMCLLAEPDFRSPDNLYAACFSTLRQSPALHGFYLVLGSGIPCSSPKGLRDCFDAAVRATQCGVALGYDRYYASEKLGVGFAPLKPISASHLETLRQGLLKRDEGALVGLVHALFAEYGSDFTQNPPAAFLLPQMLMQFASEDAKNFPGQEQLVLRARSRLAACATVEAEKTALIETFREFCRLSVQKLSPSCAAVQTFLAEHYTEPISLEQLGKLAGLSPRYLGNLFLRETGQTVTQFIRRKRLALAQSLLADTSLSIAQIAQQVGYQDYRYLCRIFEKEFGRSPGRYRREITVGRLEAHQRL